MARLFIELSKRSAIDGEAVAEETRGLPFLG